jgi:hypothetical protein
MTDLRDDMAEGAIRNYLIFLEDPGKLIDHELIEQLQQEAQATSDPIERLKRYAEMDRASRSDDSDYKLDFILHAKAWAEANKVGPAAFKQLGVKDDVLKSAGLLDAGGRRGRKVRKPDVITGRASVSAETIKAHVRSLRGTFTLADVSAAVGGSPMTVRKAVQELVNDDTIRRLGPAPDWRGRGRAPIVFETS